MKTTLAALVCLALLLSPLAGVAHADRRRTGIIFVSIGATVAAAGIAALATGIWARTAAPNADTLMQYNRLSNISDGAIVPGVIGMVLAAPLLTMAGFSLAAPRESPRPRVSLWAAPAGPGFALGGSF
jgi:hypothetical protein